MIQYDPDTTPEITEEVWQIARANGAFPIEVICDQPNAKPGDGTGVAVIALVNAVPRTGEHIWLEDKSLCVVDSVTHRLITARHGDGRAKFVMAVPIVHAITIQRSPPT